MWSFVAGWFVGVVAMLVAWQLGKDRVDELWTTNDEAALLLTDRSRRSFQQWPERV